MAIVKTKVKKEPKPSHIYSLRTDTALHERVESIFNHCKQQQQSIVKAEFLRTALERGLDSIESELKEEKK